MEVELRVVSCGWVYVSGFLWLWYGVFVVVVCLVC